MLFDIIVAVVVVLVVAARVAFRAYWHYSMLCKFLLKSQRFLLDTIYIGNCSRIDCSVAQPDAPVPQFLIKSCPSNRLPGAQQAVAY